MPLHSQVVASSSRVLREAPCRGGGGGSSKVGASQAAAVQETFEGCEQQVVPTFLRLFYNQTAAEEIPADASIWRELLALADKLDAPAVLQVTHKAAGDPAQFKLGPVQSSSHIR